MIMSTTKASYLGGHCRLITEEKSKLCITGYNFPSQNSVLTEVVPFITFEESSADIEVAKYLFSDTSLMQQDLELRLEGQRTLKERFRSS
jgi:hypothetical protein